VVTRDATPAAGASAHCARNVRAGFAALFSLGARAAGRAAIRERLRLCAEPADAADVQSVGYWLQVPPAVLSRAAHSAKTYKCGFGGPGLCGRWWQSCRARKAHAAVLCELARLGDGRHRASAQGAFDAFAMGNYPYASHYIGGSVEHPLPAWPMRAACAFMAEPRLSEDALLQARWKVTAPSCPIPKAM
jgi:hypothetical protein